MHNKIITKITRPQSSFAVSRERLFGLLDNLKNKKLIWLTGSPGAGKTTLASTYIAERNLSHIWYQLDETDEDIANFFEYLKLAIQQNMSKFCTLLPAYTPQYQAGLPSFIRLYAEAIAEHINSPALLVLDNYEKLTSSAKLHEVIRELSCCLPSEIFVLTLSRAEPPSAFARMQLHCDLAIIRGAELNMTQEEVNSFCESKQLQGDYMVDKNQAFYIFNQCQGWIAGFTFLLINKRESLNPCFENTEKQKFIFDAYFSEEFFGGFSPMVQHGLITSALLPTMTLQNVFLLTGNDEIGIILIDLQQKNCFVVQRGQTEPIFEYHALFRDFLLDKAKTIPNIEWRILQKRAADLLADSLQIDAAVNLYRTIEDWQSLVSIVIREGQGLISAGRHITLQQWLNYVPKELFNQSFWLYYWLGMARLPFEPLAARGHLEKAYSGFTANKDVKGLYSSWAGIMDAIFYECEDLRSADVWITEFDKLRFSFPDFPSQSIELRTYWAMGTLLHRQPQHPFLPYWAGRADAILSSNELDLSVLVGGFLVIYHLWRGSSSKARELIQRIHPWTISSELSPLISILWSCALGLYYGVLGEKEACLQSVKAGLLLGERTGLHCWDFLLSAQAARASLIVGDLASAEMWISKMSTAMRRATHLNGSLLEHLRSNAAAQHGEYYQAIEHARRGLAMAQETGSPFLEGQCRIDLAQSLIKIGDSYEWSTHLIQAEIIGKDMKSKVLQYLCLETGAYAAFERGNDEVGKELLSSALGLSREMGGACWQMLGYQAYTQIYERALIAGIEIDHVHQLIRQRQLTPTNRAPTPELWPWPVRIFTLGRREIYVNNKILSWQRKAPEKTLEFIMILCAIGGQANYQDLIDILWPDSEGDAAETSLNTTLHRLRKLLGFDLVIRSGDRTLSLNDQHVWVDALVFERMAKNREALDKISLQSALSLYTGHFLAGETALPVLTFRNRLFSQFIKISERLGGFYEQEENWVSAIDCYSKVFDIESAEETFCRRLMVCLVKLGRRTEAIAIYQACRLALLKKVGVSPSRETQGLYKNLFDS